MEEKNNQKSDRALKEEKILQFWKDNKIFEKSLEKKAPKGEFVFYEGPPTANAAPALHHLVSRVFKDALPRYKTMQGFCVPRKAGWDTHGLPVELQIEKKLGLKSKKEIEDYGIARFNEDCRKSVFEYIGDWEKFTERIGYWVNFKEAYYTFNNSYIETLWSVLSHVEKRKLLYKDYKVLPWCPRCGTALSSHELAQGYQDVKDISLYVKFKVVGEENTYFLAWTTTSWTLPGNVALAVGKNIEYVKVKVGDEFLILAKKRLISLVTKPDEFPVVKEMIGRDLVGLEYEPLYPFLNDIGKRYLETDYSGGSPGHQEELKKQKEAFKNVFKVYVADFVNTEDGTGIVHTAVMYGQDDFQLGNEIGLPKYHLVDETGHFKPETDRLAGKSVVEEETAVEILKDLQNRNLLFKKESHTHSYPFCWRCKTRLIYYARDSWYIAMSKLRDELVKENEKINWEPSHIKEGRFGEWLREIKDWAISRERYWGTPLPVWENDDKGKRIVVDSLETLKKYSKRSGNKYFMMRHGQAGHNVKNIEDRTGDPNNHLTDFGKEQVQKAGIKDIDMIICSPFLRSRETAAIIKKDFTTDERLRELGIEETYPQARKRMLEVVYELERKHKDKRILLISHQGPLSELLNGKSLNTAEVAEMDFVPLPHNDNFELDLHRPYIDEVVLEKDGEEYRRVKEVMDVWFDSGAMPFAQDPENVRFPADFISEAIDQTRGWFYTLHAIGVLMDKGHAYNNVICLGHILDKEGKKMSKSVGNIVNPWEMMDKYGVDTLRLWMYSVNQPGESKNFDERSVDELQKRIFNLLDNVYSFYELYKKENDTHSDSLDFRDFKGELDRWIIVRLYELINQTTHYLDNFKLLEPVRAIREFIDDLSTWYLRRSRERIRNGDKDALRVLSYTLKTLAKLLAPFAPFAAEDLYQKLRSNTDSQSVHLEGWPIVLDGKPMSSDSPVLLSWDEAIGGMLIARNVVSLALEQRQKSNIKVRQPLSKLEIKNTLGTEYLEIIRDELNVKEIIINPNLETEISLDTNITPELEEEGKVRDAIRAVQEWRKEQGLKPGQGAEYKVIDNREFYLKHKMEIEKATQVELI